jgi:hypothetical protein
MATSNSIFHSIVTIFNNRQCNCQFIIMNIIKWYYPAREGRSCRIAAVKSALYQGNNAGH